MWAYPGKKLLFMGGEFGQAHEWRHDESLDWHLCQFMDHEGVRLLVRDLNRLYLAEPVLHANDFNAQGFRWVNCKDADSNVISYLRLDAMERTVFLVVGNYSGALRGGYRVGVPKAGFWAEILNTNSEYYGGAGQGNEGGRTTEGVSCDGLKQSLVLTLPPLTTLIFKWSLEPADSPKTATPLPTVSH
jgi:1,4-alpha-glucan branching enzyme